MITCHHEGPVAHLLLDRGNARNAISVAGWEALAAAAATLADSDTRAVILRSRDPDSFSAGADIAEFESMRSDPAEATRFRLAMAGAIGGVAALPMPVIAAIDGGCYGAAVALALACDLRIAGNGARFAVTPARLGLSYPATDVARLARRVGQGQAARLLLTAETIHADEALRIGLAEVRAVDAAEAAAAFAARIAGNAPQAVRLLKRTLANPTEPALDAAFDAAFAGPELAEGLAAFKERRAPRFA